MTVYIEVAALVTCSAGWKDISLGSYLVDDSAVMLGSLLAGTTVYWLAPFEVAAKVTLTAANSVS